MIQYICVGLLFMLALGFIIRLTYNSFFGKKKNGCEGCPMASAHGFDKKQI